MNFVKLHENCENVKNRHAAAHHAQKLLFPMEFHRFWRPSAPESGKCCKMCNFHPFSHILRKFGENDRKSALFLRFHSFGVEKVKRGPVLFIWLSFKAQIVMRNQDSCIPSWWRIPVLRSSEPFCAEDLFWRKLDFCKKR